jgi:hypothetical protein
MPVRAVAEFHFAGTELIAIAHVHQAHGAGCAAHHSKDSGARLTFSRAEKHTVLGG